MKKITLCADDFGQNPTISEGIINLVKIKRLSAVSCLTTFTYWQKYAELLLPYQDNIDVGLHFNLTEGVPLTADKNFTFYSWHTLLKKARSQQIKQDSIENEFSAQLDNFISALGKIPDFIDGHQHVHHYPIIRDAILAVYQRRFVKYKPYIRICSNGYIDSLIHARYFPYEFLITLDGALKLKRQLQQLKIPHNHSFEGTYNFDKANRYQHYFQSFLSRISDGGLIMCHPGLVSNDTNDLIYKSRPFEYSYFMSDEFIADCAEHKVTLGKFFKE